MERDRLERLTDQQRVCLRHVYAHKTSKEIAPLLGIAPNSVDQHIKAAMRVLGVADRRSAAMMLAAYEELPSPAVAMREEQSGYDPTPSPPKPIPERPPGGLRHTYDSWPKRVAWIIALTIGIALAFGTLIAGAEALTRLVWG